MTTSARSQEEIVARARRFILAFDESSAIDDLAVKLAGSPDKPARIKSAADEFAAEMKRVGCSELFTRYCRATFTLVLSEKIQLAEMGGEPCRSH